MKNRDFDSAEWDARILESRWINVEYKYLRVRSNEIGVRAVAGQFFHLLCPTTDEDRPFFRRPMSIYGIKAYAGELEFLYKVQGSGTRGLATLKAGDTLNLFGPLGNGFAVDEHMQHMVVIGRGVGLATLAPLVQSAAEKDIKVTAILSARTPELLMSQKVFEDAGANVLTVTDQQGTSGPSHVERLIRRLLITSSVDMFFTCGSRRLTSLLQRLGKEFSIPGQVAIEQQMACGLGMCFCCTQNFMVQGEIINRRVCWDGPVFDIKEALPW